MGLFARMAFEPHRIGPTEITTLFRQKVKEGFERRHPTLDRSSAEPGRPLVIHKHVDILKSHTSPRLGANRHKLTHITDIINGHAPTREPTIQVFGKLGNVFILIYGAPSAEKSCPLILTQYKAPPVKLKRQVLRGVHRAPRATSEAG
jgi:hypothetical protein